MNILEQLKQVLNEADEKELLPRNIEVNSSMLKFKGVVSYSSGSNIELALTVEMPTHTKVYSTKQTFDSLAEDDLREASDKIQHALEDLAEEFNTSLKNKLASYGLNEGENNEHR